MNKRKPTKKKKPKTYLKTNEDPGRDLNKEKKGPKKKEGRMVNKTAKKWNDSLVEL